MKTSEPTHVVGNLRGREKQWWEWIRPLLKDEFSWYAIQSSKKNPLPCPGCQDSFQFGDIRIETPKRTIVIEIESWGPGLGNLLKYWPWLKGLSGTQPAKPLVLIHIWGGSYPTWKIVYELLEKELFGKRGRRFGEAFKILPFHGGMDDKDKILQTIKELFKT